MTTTEPTSASAAAETVVVTDAGPDPRRWKALMVIAIAQLMVVLDASIVNIAMPSMQADLGITDADRQWIVTAYTLTFGSLLLLGGRIADYAGRKNVFIIGLLGFAGASALGGLSNSAATLFAARGLQGLFAALLAPAALSLITVTFTESKERARAFGVYGAISGGGAAIGLVLGGLLTQYASWHWTLLVNVPIALVAVALAIPYVRNSRAEGNTKYDIPGAIAATTGLFCLVFGITKAGTDGWGSQTAVTFLAISVVLLFVFLFIEYKSTHPLLPLRIVLDRNRGGAYLASFFVGIGMFSMFLFISYFFQAVLGYSPLTSGLLFLPFSAGVIISAGIASQLLPRFGPRWVTFTGFVMATIGMSLYLRLGADSTYAPNILPSIIIMSLGMGLIFVPLSATALSNVGNHDAGVASAVLNTAQQIGGSIGIAFLNTIAASATTAFIVENALQGPNPDALVAGFTAAFAWSVGIMIVAAIVWVSLVRLTKDDLSASDTVAVH